MNKQERKELFFSFFDQLKPEHAEKAKANYDPTWYDHIYLIENHSDALNWGFDWEKSPEGEDSWLGVDSDLRRNIYPLQMTPRSCKAAAMERLATSEDMEKMEDILEEALRITGGDRMADYGPPDQDFKRTAIMWEQILNSRIVDGELKIKPQDVASCMIALKLSRQTHQGKRDNWVDISGYARCGNLCEELEQ